MANDNSCANNDYFNFNSKYMVSNKIIYKKMNFYYDVNDMNISIHGTDWKPVEFLSNENQREEVRQHILKKDLTQRIGGEKYMKLVKPEPEDSIIDTMLQLENEMAIGK